MDLDKPVNKNRSHTFIDVRLVLHIEWADGCGNLLPPEVLVHILNIVGNAKRILSIALINIVGRPKLVTRSVG